MTFLRKKQIILATLCAIFSIFTFMFTTAKEEVKETVSLPVSRENSGIRCWSWSAR